VFLADLHQVGEADIRRFAPHLFEDFSSSCHVFNGINSGTMFQAVQPRALDRRIQFVANGVKLRGEINPGEIQTAMPLAPAHT
jgi:hypothetical protein